MTWEDPREDPPPICARCFAYSHEGTLWCRHCRDTAPLFEIIGELIYTEEENN